MAWIITVTLQVGGWNFNHHSWVLGRSRKWQERSGKITLFVVGLFCEAFLGLQERHQLTPYLSQWGSMVSPSLKNFFFFFKATRQIAIQIESGGLRYQGQWGLLFGDEHRSVCYGLGVAGKPMSGAEIWGWEKLTFWIRNERRVWNEMWQVPW